MDKALRILLLGTGTDVGKTYVGTQLTQAWRQKVGPVLALKPVESGFPIDQEEKAETRESSYRSSSDAVSLATDAGKLSIAATEGHRPLYTFRDPVSPHLAARRENRVIEISKIRGWVQTKEDEFAAGLEEAGKAEPHEGRAGRRLTLIESAGGVFSPLSSGVTNLELALELDPAFWILVAPDSIGVLHDLGACLRAMRGRSPDLVLLSASRPSDATAGSNAAEIQQVVYPLLGEEAPVHQVIPLVERGGDGASLLEQVLLLSRQG